jgi:hypothetical protein
MTGWLTAFGLLLAFLLAPAAQAQMTVLVVRL